MISKIFESFRAYFTDVSLWGRSAKNSSDSVAPFQPLITAAADVEAAETAAATTAAATATMVATARSDGGECKSNGGGNGRPVAPSQNTLLSHCVLIQPPPVLTRGSDRRDQRQAVPFVRACPLQDGFVRRGAVIPLRTRTIPSQLEPDYSAVLERGEKEAASTTTIITIATRARRKAPATNVLSGAGM